MPALYVQLNIKHPAFSQTSLHTIPNCFLQKEGEAAVYAPADNLTAYLPAKIPAIQMAYFPCGSHILQDFFHTPLPAHTLPLPFSYAHFLLSFSLVFLPLKFHS